MNNVEKVLDDSFFVKFFLSAYEMKNNTFQKRPCRYTCKQLNKIKTLKLDIWSKNVKI